MNMDRRDFLKKYSAVAGSIALLNSTKTLAGAMKLRNSLNYKRPNIVIFLADDLGYQDLGCYGNNIIKTPNIDKLASQGVRFTDCYAASPVCSPSRAGLLTGRIPCRSMLYNHIKPGNPIHLKKEEVTIAKLLQQGGYNTSHFGKWHLNGDMLSSQPQPIDHGFDYSFGSGTSPKQNGKKFFKDPDNFIRNGKAIGPLKGYPCQLIADDAAEWLDGRNEKSDPFFMFVCFSEPHTPILEAKDLPAELMAKYPAPTKEEDARYLATVTNIDIAVGKVLKKLKQSGLDDNTFVAFLSDNGPLRNVSQTPLRGIKRTIYDGGMRTPGIIRWPGHTTAGSLCDEPINFVDFLPTLCEMTKTESPNDRAIDGVSFLPVFKDEKLIREMPMFWFFYFSNPQAAMRDGDWVMVGYLEKPAPAGHSLFDCHQDYIKNTKLAKFELYNIRKDIAQTNNLAESEPRIFERMKRKMVEVHKEVIGKGPSWQNLPKCNQ